MPYTIEDARAAVAKGAALLDEKKPGWREEMDWKDCDITMPCDCVLGQCFAPPKGRGWGSYNRGLDFLCPPPADEHHLDMVQRRTRFAVEYGFDVPRSESGTAGSYMILQRAWEEESGFVVIER